MFAILSLGFVLGMQHALEADHIAAVSSIAARRSDVGDIVKHGLTWGLGHTLTLFAFAGAAILLGHAIPENVAEPLETAVGVMLVGLGAHLLWRLWRDRVHVHTHRHDDGTVHVHVHSHASGADLTFATQPAANSQANVKSKAPLESIFSSDPSIQTFATVPAEKGCECWNWTTSESVPHARAPHTHAHGFRWRTLLVGLMHGMAGSAALLVLTVSQAPSAAAGLGYIALFGIGSMIGMGLLSTAIAVPIAISAQFLTLANHALQGAVGLITIAIGLNTIVATTLS
jgi:ABC-type nickel/cobalt efflux system permease component RcnA